MSFFNKFKIKTIAKYTIFTVLLGLLIKKPFEQFIVDTIYDSIINWNYDEGRVDLNLFENYSSKKNAQAYILSLYKSDTQKLIELSKEKTNNENWISNDEKMRVHLNDSNTKLQGLAKSNDDNLLAILSNNSSLIHINDLQTKETKPLIIFTMKQYYSEKFRDSMGLAFSFSYLVFIIATTLYNKRNIITSPKQKKKILLL